MLKKLRKAEQIIKRMKTSTLDLPNTMNEIDVEEYKTKHYNELGDIEYLFDEMKELINENS
jgi:hypothetical protein